MPHTKEDDVRHVMLNEMPTVDASFEDADLEEKWSRLIGIRSDVSKVLETARAQKIIGQSLGAKVMIQVNDANAALLNEYRDM